MLGALADSASFVFQSGAAEFSGAVWAAGSKPLGGAVQCVGRNLRVLCQKSAEDCEVVACVVANALVDFGALRFDLTAEFVKAHER